jgi:hypothetical protein
MKKTSTAIKARKTSDLKDSAADEQKLQPDTATINIPDVKDIPGQEHVRPPKMKSFGDTTVSSSDEEDIVADRDNNVSSTEKTLLSRAGTSGYTEDEQQLLRAQLDNTDDDGELLNESGFGEDLSGDDLDIPGAEDDDTDEAIGEEDEENNSYSLPDDKE